MNLKDAYFNISIKQSAQRFLPFTFEGKVYQLCDLPFGLTTAPLVFANLFQIVVSFLPNGGIDVYIYFDDYLILYPVRVTLVLCLESIASGFIASGIIPFRENQDFVFLGYRFLPLLGIVCPYSGKFAKAKLMITNFVGLAKV